MPNARVSAAAYPAVLQVAHRGVRHAGPLYYGGIVDPDGGPRVRDDERVRPVPTTVPARQGALERGACRPRQQSEPGRVSKRPVQRKARGG